MGHMKNAAAEELRGWFVHPEQVRPSAMSATLDEALRTERLHVFIRLKARLLEEQRERFGVIPAWALDVMEEVEGQ